jgi:type I restriction enzyme, R subunit
MRRTRPTPTEVLRIEKILRVQPAFRAQLARKILLEKRRGETVRVGEGNWEEREGFEGKGNRNIEPQLLGCWLEKQGHSPLLISKVLYEVEKVAGDTSKSLYDRNKEVYAMLRYGVNVRLEAGENKERVMLIDWKHPDRNDFGVAEEVTVGAASAKAHGKRPDVVVYVNGIALAVLELKRSTVSVAEGIRQNYESQKKEFIEPFFSTVQLMMAGSDTEGLRYGTTRTREKYYLAWKEERSDWRPGVDVDQKYMTLADYPGVDSPLDMALIQLCNKERLLDLIHNFVVFDGGTKKLCRHNQYFGVRAAQAYVKRREGGIIWQTQGSGKSIVMVWLTKWIRENVSDARVLIITDRQELDEQIHERVFKPAGEEIYRTRSGQDLIATLNSKKPWLICSLIHKFGGKGDSDAEADDFIREMKKALPADFKAKGNLFVLVDECHRTQSGMLHEAMKEILPDAVFIGFTGTPLLKKDKQTTLELFGSYIHTYKFDEAVADGVVLDLRYEAREIDQEITSQRRIDEWFELKTRGLTDLAKAQLKQRWGTMQKVLSCRSRLGMIVSDILVDMERCDRLRSGRGNAILVAGSIYEACKYFDLFADTNLQGQCAIVTSYVPSVATIKGEDSGEGQTEKLEQYEIYKKMLADWFDVPPEQAVNRVEEFEKAVKKKFIDDPGEMKLLIVVDKLLTGFDAPPATYLYIDKKMQDHGLFQAICRVNRLDGEDKEFGYIVDYKDLFRSLEGAVHDYTFDAYDKEDVAGLLEDRLEKAQERLEDALEQIRALCEPVEMPRDQAAYFSYFSSEEPGNGEQRKANEPQRLALYKLTASLIRAYANIADEILDAGYTEAQAEAIKKEVTFYEHLRTEVKIHSADAIDLKQYEPSMRHLIDTYIRANTSEVISKSDDFSLVQLIVERGAEAVKALPESIQRRQEAVAETIENNVRKLIIDESPVNPKYYERMSELLDALIKERREGAIAYAEYLAKIVELTKQAKNGPGRDSYPHTMNTPARKALYDNLNKNHVLALAVDTAVLKSRQDDWRSNTFKTRRVRNAIQTALKEWTVPMRAKGHEVDAAIVQEEAPPYQAPTEAEIDRILELVKNQSEY